MKSFRDRYDAYLAAGENETLLEDRCKTRIRDGAAKIVDSSTFDEFQDIVSQVRLAVKDTPVAATVNERFICDTLLDAFKRSSMPGVFLLHFQCL
jgi:hypothetical protein